MWDMSERFFMQNLQTFSTSFMSLHAPFMLFMFRLSSTA